MDPNGAEFSKFMLENVATVLVRISEVILRFFDHNTQLDRIIALYDILGSSGVIDPIIRILSESLKALNSKTTHSLLKILSLCCKASYSLASQAIHTGVIPLIAGVLMAESEKEVKDSLILSEVMYLLEAILPDYVAQPKDKDSS